MIMKQLLQLKASWNPSISDLIFVILLKTYSIEIDRKYGIYYLNLDLNVM